MYPGGPLVSIDIGRRTRRSRRRRRRAVDDDQCAGNADGGDVMKYGPLAVPVYCFC